MKRTIQGFVLLFCLALFSGCSLSPDDKVTLEQSLKQNVDTFINGAVQVRWDDAFRLTDGNFSSSDNLREQLTKSWPQDGVVTGGEIASMAWVNDKTAKVKVNWAFQTGSVASFSSETFVWVLKGGSWKYLGRTLR